MESGQLNTIAIQVAYIMVLFLIFIGFLFWWRMRLGKKVGSGDYLVAEIIPPAGKARTELLRVINGEIKVKPKNSKKGKIFKVTDLNTYPIDYPSLPHWLGILQVTAEKVILDEESAEPLTNRRGIGGISPETLYSWEEGMATQAATAMSKAEEEAHQKVSPKKKSGFSLMWIIIGVVILAVAVVGFIMLKKYNESKDALGIASMLWQMMV